MVIAFLPDVPLDDPQLFKQVVLDLICILFLLVVFFRNDLRVHQVMIQNNVLVQFEPELALGHVQHRRL